MKKFIVKTICTLAAFASILIILYMVNRHGASFRIEDDKHVLIIGNSHPECAFNDKLIPGTANFSESGETYFYTYIKLKKLLDQNPQIDNILLEFSNVHIKKEMDKWIWGDMYLSYRFPKYASFMDSEALELLLKYNPKTVKESIPLLSRTNANMLLNYRLDYTKVMGGYLSIDKSTVDSLLANMPAGNNPNGGQMRRDSLSVENLIYLDKIIDYSEQKGVKVFLIRSPMHEEYPEYKNEQRFHDVRLSKYRNVEFLDFSRYPLANSEFTDLDHLNHKGATKFSTWFAKLMKDGLFDKTDKQAFIDEEIGMLAQTE